MSLVPVSSSEHVFPLHSGWENTHSLLLSLVPSPQVMEQEAQAPQGVQAALTGWKYNTTWNPNLVKVFACREGEGS